MHRVVLHEGTPLKIAWAPALAVTSGPTARPSASSWRTSASTVVMFDGVRLIPSATRKPDGVNAAAGLSIGSPVYVSDESVDTGRPPSTTMPNRRSLYAPFPVVGTPTTTPKPAAAVTPMVVGPGVASAELARNPPS